jgi:hypothetical protein
LWLRLEPSYLDFFDHTENELRLVSMVAVNDIIQSVSL